MIRLLFGLIVVLVGPAYAYPISVVSCDRILNFTKPPKAAISNDTNITEMMLILGLEDHMIGYTDVPSLDDLMPQVREVAAKIPNLSYESPTKELIVGHSADFYFAGWNYGLKVAGDVTPDTLGAFGINVYELTESCIHLGPRPDITLETMYIDLLNLGKIFGEYDRALKLVARYRNEVAEALESSSPLTNPPRVFIYDSGKDMPFTAGRFAMPTALIRKAGGKNILDDIQKSWTTIGWETVIDRNPEIIIIVNYGEVTAEQKRYFLLTHPAFSDLDAVRNDKFIVLDYNEATPGPRNIDAVKRLAAYFRSK